MAKKKKLNKKIVIVLVLVGAAMVGGYGLTRSRVRDYLFPKDPVAAAERAKALMETGDFPGANLAYHESVIFSQTQSQQARYLYEWAQMKLRWLREQGKNMQQSEKRERLQEAISHFRTSLRCDPQFVEPQRRLCEIYWDFLTRNKDYPPKTFIGEADALLTLDDKDHVTYFRRGVAKGRLAAIAGSKIAKEALADFAKAIELKDTVRYRAYVAQFLNSLDRPEKATEAYVAGIAAHPDSTSLRVSYAQHLAVLKRREEALEQINEAIKRAPKNPLGQYALGVFYHQEDPEKARKAFLKVLELDNTYARAYIGLNQLYVKQKDYTKAAELLRTGIRTVTEAEEPTTRAATRPTSQPTTKATVESQDEYLTLPTIRREAANRRLTALLVEVLFVVAQDQPGEQEKIVAELKTSLARLRELGADEANCNSIAGRIALLEGKDSEAVELLRKAYDRLEEQNRTDRATAGSLIKIYLSQGLPGRAEEILDRLLARPSERNNPWIRLQKAQLEMVYQNLDESARYLKEVLVIDPGNATAKQWQMLLGILTGQTTSGLPPQLKLEPWMFSMLLRHVTALAAEEQFDQAIKLLEDMHARDVANRRVIARLAAMYERVNEPGKANTLLEEAQRSQPGEQDNIKLARMLMAEKDPVKRFQLQMAEIDKIDDDLKRTLAKIMLCRVAKVRNLRAKYIKQAVEIDPNDRRVISERFRYAIDEKDWELASKIADQAAGENIDGVQGKLYFARLAEAKGLTEEAAETLREILQMKPNDKATRTRLGRLLLLQNKVEEAEEAFRIVTTNDPGYGPAVIGMMQATARLGKQEEYYKWLERAHRIAPRNNEVAQRYLYRQEQNADNVDAIIAKREKMLSKNPRDLRNRLSLAALYERTQRLAEAEAMYRYVRDNISDELVGARILAEFYGRRGRLGLGIAVIQDLLKVTNDKVGAYVLYGEFVAPFQPTQAKRAFDKAIAIDENDPRGHLAMARFFASTKPPQWAAAARAMTAYLRLHGKDIAVEQELIRYLIASTQFAEAQSRLAPMLQENATDPGVLRLEAELVLQRDRNMAKAEDLLSQAIQANPNDVNSLASRARLYVAQREFQKAKRDLERAKQIIEDPQILLALASVYEQIPELNKAEEVLRKVLGDRKTPTPFSAPAIKRLISLYMRQRKWSGSRGLEELLIKARKMFPTESTYWLAEAKMWRARKNTTKRLAALVEAISRYPDSEPVLASYVQALLETDKYEQILNVTEDYQDRLGFGVWVRGVRGWALAKLGRQSEADAILKAATEAALPDELAGLTESLAQVYGPARAAERLIAWGKNADKWQLHLALGDLYFRAGQEKEALTSLRRAFDLADKRSPKADISYRRGVVHHTAKRFDAAKEAYLTALKYLPTHPGALNNLAYIYAEDLSEPAKGLVYAEQAIRYMPDNASVIDTYGWVLARMGKYAEAEKEFRKALDKPDAPAVSRYHLGWMYEQQGRFTKALSEYERGMEMNVDPVDPELKGMFDKAIADVQKRLKPEITK
ncbi:MAG: tetratricopeptide repeat protein [Planctomycetes bacterium]|nr:tetratricopeptide repeat protein [Planctomycetota bacterium]